jgi:hypothetical protein
VRGWVIPTCTVLRLRVSMSGGSATHLVVAHFACMRTGGRSTVLLATTWARPLPTHPAERLTLGKIPQMT